MLKNVIYSNKTKKFFYYVVLFFLTFYLFSITAFNEIEGLHYINYVAIIMLILFSLIYEILYLKRIFLTRYFLFICLFVLYAGLITIINNTSLSKVITISITSFSFIILYQVVKIINDDKFLLLSLMFAAFAYFIFFIAMDFHKILSLDFLDGRLGGNIGNENTVGVNLLMYASVFCFASLSKKRWYFIFGSIPFLILSFFTGSKKVLLGFLLLGMVMLFLIFKKRKLILIISILLFVLISFLALQLPIFSTINDRIISMINSLLNDEIGASTGLRKLYTEIGLYLGGQNMFFGLGADGFLYNTNFGTYSHNNFVELFCDFGLIGSFIFYIPMLIVIFKIKNNDNSKIFIFGFFMILFLFLIGFAMIFYYSKTLPIFYAFAFGTLKKGVLKLKQKIEI